MKEIQQLQEKISQMEKEIRQLKGLPADPTPEPVKHIRSGWQTWITAEPWPEGKDDDWRPVCYKTPRCSAMRNSDSSGMRNAVNAEPRVPYQPRMRAMCGLKELPIGKHGIFRCDQCGARADFVKVRDGANYETDREGRIIIE